MPRSRNVPARKRRRQRTLKAAKGYYGARSRQYKAAAIAVERARANAYRDRKRKKREFRKLWITRINAACRMRDTKYSTFINGLKKAGVEINRKMLSELAISDAAAFDQLVETANAAL
ncbi:MAG: 50S ribosomal protein L20 [Planctomycetota bacterium]